MMGFGRLTLACILLLTVVFCVSTPMPRIRGGENKNAERRGIKKVNERNERKSKLVLASNKEDGGAIYPASTFVNASRTAPGAMSSSGKAATTALPVIGVDVPWKVSRFAKMVKHYRRGAAPRAFMIFKENSTTPATPNTPDWKGTRDTVDGAVKAVDGLKTAIDKPSTKTIVKAVETTVGLLATFFPQIGPFASAIFGIINMFMPQSVGALKTQL